MTASRIALHDIFGPGGVGGCAATQLKREAGPPMNMHVKAKGMGGRRFDRKIGKVIEGRPVWENLLILLREQGIVGFGRGGWSHMVGVEFQH